MGSEMCIRDRIHADKTVSGSALSISKLPAKKEVSHIHERLLYHQTVSVKSLFHIVILKGCDVMIAVVLTFIGKDAQDFASRVQRGQAGNG